MSPKNLEQKGDLSRREEKWISYNLDRLGRLSDHQGQQIEDRHWVDRFKVKVWRVALRCYLRLMKEEGENEPTPFQVLVFSALPVALSTIPAIIVAVALTWNASLYWAWHWVAEIAKRPWGRCEAFFMLVVVGVLAFLARKNLRTFYGVAELAFSFWTLFYGVTEARGADPESIKAFFAVVGGLYVMVRAIDNIVEGWKEAGRLCAELTRLPSRREVVVTRGEPTVE